MWGWFDIGIITIIIRSGIIIIRVETRFRRIIINDVRLGCCCERIVGKRRCPRLVNVVVVVVVGHIGMRLRETCVEHIPEQTEPVEEKRGRRVDEQRRRRAFTLM